MTSETYDIDLEEGTIDGEDLADFKARHDELEAIVDRHARIVAAYGLDFSDNGHLVIADRILAITRFGEDAVKRLEDDC